MKHNIYKISCFLWCLLWLQVAYAQEQTKSFNKSYAVSGKEKLKISNQFGKVQVNTSSGSQIIIKVNITVEASSTSKTKALLDAIQINESVSNGVIYIRTSTSDKERNTWKSRGRTKMDIDYTITMPSNFPLELKNRFGDTYIGDFSGPLIVSVAHGDLRTAQLTGTKEKSLRVQFGDLDVKRLQNGKVKVAHGDVEIEQGSQVEVNSAHGDIALGTISNLNIDNQHGDVSVRKVEKAVVECDFGDTRIGYVGKSLTTDTSHGDVRVENVGESCQSVQAEAQHGDV
ncbi:MAG: hypothetical protein AAF734_02305, partial [Bacteroidota bacterium]